MSEDSSRGFDASCAWWPMLVLGCLSACGLAGEGTVDAGQALGEELPPDSETGDLSERVRQPCPNDGNACTTELRHGSRCDSQPKADGTPCPGGVCAAGQCVAKPALCGDGVCAAGESYQSCPADCRTPDPCGNGVCAAGESCQSCPADCSCSACATVGIDAFHGCYYDNMDFTGLLLERTDPQVDFDWQSGSPDVRLGADTFSVIWQGEFAFDAAQYELVATTDDGLRLYLDGQLILESWVDHPATAYRTVRAIAAGRHRLRLEYYENLGDAAAHLSWSKVSVPTCTPESDALLCSRLGITCGPLTATDNCDSPRTVASCGACPQELTAAFPGAQGGGALSKGGRGGTVIKVTNLNDSGPGSLRACVEASGPRTCVFTVSGTIALATELLLTRPYITIAGQTSPGGIELRGGIFFVKTNDVIARYLRVRSGPGNLLIGNGANKVVIDHVSTAYTDGDDQVNVWCWEATDIVGFGLLPAKNVTLSWLLSSYPINSATHGAIEGKKWSSDNTGGVTEASMGLMTDIDVIRSFITNASHRTPHGMGRRGRWVNNIAFNAGWYWSRVGGKVDADFVGNVYRCGAFMSSACATLYPLTIFTCADNGSCPNHGLAGMPSVHFHNNAWLSNATTGLSAADVSDTTAWANMVRPKSLSSGSAADITGSSATQYKRDVPLAAAAEGIAVTPIAIDANGANLARALLDNASTGAAARAAAGIDYGPVGASRRLDCSGKWVNQVDALDQRALNEYLGLGDPTYNPPGGLTSIPPASPAAICWAAGQCGYPALTSGAACADADNDGLPDVYETAKCGSPTACSANEVASGGYTRLEHFLNGTAP